MKEKLLTTLTTLTLFQTISLAGDWDFLSVDGYGTIGGAYQNNNEILYRDLFYVDKGSQGNFSLENYTLLGLQLKAKATDNLTLTLQGIASANNENNKLLDLQWANIKYQINDAFDVRAGLMRLPAYMFSDISHIAYLYDRISLPDMYSLVPFNKYNGVEFSYNFNINNELMIHSTLLYGNAKSNSKFIREGNLNQSNIKINDIYMVALKFLYHNLALRVGYSQNKATIYDNEVNALFAQFNAFGISSISEAIEKYKFENTPLSYFNLGAQYNFTNSYLLGEYLKTNSESFIPDMSSWYVSAGYNFNQWTPYLLYSRAQQDSNYAPISTQGVPSQVAELIHLSNYIFSMIGELPEVDKKTLSFGLRYDINENLLLKFQYENQERFGKKLNVFSSAMNFIF